MNDNVKRIIISNNEAIKSSSELMLIAGFNKLMSKISHKNN